jgi:hypothetical protein
MREKSSGLLVLALAALVAYLVSCLTRQNKEMTDSIAEATKQVSEASKVQMATITETYSTTFQKMTERVTGLAEVLMLGRDSPTPSETSSTNSNESEQPKEQEIDMSDLPASASWAAEEEERLHSTEMPWQLSMPPTVSE